MKPLMIGQAPGRADGEPCRGPAFARLAQVAGVEEAAFFDAFERTNLLSEYPGRAAKGDLFPRRLAERAAERMAPRLRGRVVVLMGRNVAWAFGVDDLHYLTWYVGRGGWARFAVCPHPSGVNRWWNDEGNRDRAGEFFQQLVRYSQGSLEELLDA